MKVEELFLTHIQTHPAVNMNIVLIVVNI